MDHVGLVKAMAHRSGAAPAVAGGDLRADQRRRDRSDRRGRPLQAVARRAVRCLRAPPHPGRDARLAARARLGAAVAAQDAPRRRRGHRQAAAHAEARADRGRMAGELSMSPAEYDKMLDQMRTLDLGAIRSSMRRRGRVAAARAVPGSRRRARTRSCTAPSCARCWPTPSASCPSASAKSWRSTTKRS